MSFVRLLPKLVAVCLVAAVLQAAPASAQQSFTCTVTDNGDGSVQVSWDDIYAKNYNVSHDGGTKQWTNGTVTTYRDRSPGTDYTVVGRAFDGTKSTATCTAPGIVTPPTTLVCNVIDNGNGSVQVSWNDVTAKNYNVAHDGGSKQWMNGSVTTYRDRSPGIDYTVVGRLLNGTKLTATCTAPNVGPPPPGPIAFTCSTADNGDGTVQITWTDAKANGYNVTDDGGTKQWVKGSFTYTDNTPADNYTIKAWANGLSTTATCAGPIAANPVAAPVACAYATQAAGQAAGSSFRVGESGPTEFATTYNAYDANMQYLMNTSQLTQATYNTFSGEEPWVWVGDVLFKAYVTWGAGAYTQTSYGQYIGSVRYVTAVRNGQESDPIQCVLGGSPIGFDLDGDGAVNAVAADIDFDLTGDGNVDHLGEWFEAGTGILFDSTIDGTMSGQHLFGDQGGTYTDGFAKLALRDTNGDGQISGAELDGLALWVDNGNAVVDAGEIESLADHAVASISTGHSNYAGTATLNNGDTMYIEDLWFTTQ